MLGITLHDGIIISISSNHTRFGELHIIYLIIYLFVFIDNAVPYKLNKVW